MLNIEFDEKEELLRYYEQWKIAQERIEREDDLEHLAAVMDDNDYLYFFEKKVKNIEGIF
jgi:hypothetical protein